MKISNKMATNQIHITMENDDEILIQFMGPHTDPFCYYLKLQEAEELNRLLAINIMEMRKQVRIENED